MPATPHKPSRIENFHSLSTAQQTDLEAHLNIAGTATRPVILERQSVSRVSPIDAIRQQQMALINRQQVSALRQRVALALRRIEDGSCGDYLHRGETISDARPRAQPWANLCIDFKSARESI